MASRARHKAPLVVALLAPLVASVACGLDVTGTEAVSNNAEGDASIGDQTDSSTDVGVSNQDAGSDATDADFGDRPQDAVADGDGDGTLCQPLGAACVAPGDCCSASCEDDGGMLVCQ